MHVLYIVDYWQEIGGIETICGHVARSLVQLGVNLEVWSVRESGMPLRDGIVAQGLAPTNRLLRSAYARGLWKRDLAARVSRYGKRFDVCIAGHVGLLAPILSALNREVTQCWLWVYGIEVWGETGFARRPEISQVDRVISISRFTASQVAPWVDACRLEVVPCAVDIEEFSPRAGGNPIHRNEVLIVGRLSSLERYKGHDVLLQALSAVETVDGGPAKLVIVGDGDDRPRLEARCLELGLDAIVEFRGTVSRGALIDAYRHCSVFVMPSRLEQSRDGRWKGEGLGIVYLEAAACGRPVVASTDGGAPETVRPGETGLLVEPRDPRAVARALSTILSDVERAESMGRRGRGWVESEFSLLRLQKRIHKLLG